MSTYTSLAIIYNAKEVLNYLRSVKKASLPSVNEAKSRGLAFFECKFLPPFVGIRNTLACLVSLDYPLNEISRSFQIISNIDPATIRRVIALGWALSSKDLDMIAMKPWEPDSELRMMILIEAGCPMSSNFFTLLAQANYRSSFLAELVDGAQPTL